MPKASPRVSAYGTVDELNAWLGFCRALGMDSELDSWLEEVQKTLFTVGAQLATPPGRTVATDPVTEDDVRCLEEWIDRAEAETGALTTFILPGGTVPGAALHVARTISRRAEREISALSSSEPVPPEVLAYMNRLSDLLFAAARLASRRAGGSEKAWTGSRRRKNTKP